MRFLPKAKLPAERSSDIIGLFILAFTIFLCLALITDGYLGSTRRPLEGLSTVPNLCGPVGAVTAGILYILFGYASHVLYVLTAIWGAMLLRKQPLDRLPLRFVGMLLLTGSLAAILHMDRGLVPPAVGILVDERMPGGAFGAFATTLVKPVFGVLGGNVIMLMLGFIGVLLATEFLFMHGVRWLRAATIVSLRSSLIVTQAVRIVISSHRAEAKARRAGKPGALTEILHRTKPKPTAAEVAEAKDEPDEDLSRIRIRPEPAAKPEQLPFDMADQTDLTGQKDSVIAEPQQPAQAQSSDCIEQLTDLIGHPDAVADAPEPARVAKSSKPMPRRRTTDQNELPADYVYPRYFTRPSLNLLDNAPPRKGGEGLADVLRQTSVLLEQALQTHGIEARVTDVTRGPTITRFELEPAPGIKVNRFLALADDLALALKAMGVRVEAPIPGKGRIGIELPNKEREAVVLRELLESRAFKKDKSKLALALGKDISGDVMSADLTTMPHLLVAGATGSGKTVCIKSILASLLFTKTPEELQLVLIDPKMVELSIFNDIPHLITPVVIDAKKAATALNWLIWEMEERYRLFAQLRVRNIEVYNESVENGEIELPEQEGVETGSVDVVRKLPYIVCIIDELADLMMLARAEVEDAIMRLAQLARAVGIHLIIATQRPSVNVLTGVIKANFPVRIAFQVSSKVDSRCILDEMGAERLIGMGDMLYLPAGRAAPTRIQGAFVSDHEMDSLISYLKTQAPPQYKDEIENFGKSQEAVEEIDENDDLLDDAIRVVMETGQASISMVQRRLRVGYTRAARLIDIMELKGIVGPHLGSKAREILVNSSQMDKSA